MGYPQIKRTCKRCGREFMGGRRSRYCSDACKYPPKMCAMPGCGNIIVKATNYCSTLCRNRHIAIKNRDTGRMREAQNRPEVREKKSLGTTLAFESIEVQERHKDGIGRAHDENKVVGNNVAVKKVCPYCNNEFETFTNRKYCSRTCLNKATHTDNRLIDEELIIKLKNDGKQDYEVVEIIGHSQVKVRDTINRLVSEGKVVRVKTSLKGVLRDSTEIVKFECKYCNKQFEIKRNKLNEDKKEHKFCSPKCFYEYTKSQCPEIVKKCPTCLNDFNTRRYDQIYCSNECKLKGINIGLQNANKEKYTSEKRTEVQLKRWAEKKDVILRKRQTPEYLAKLGETTRERFANDQDFKDRFSEAMVKANAVRTPEEKKEAVLKQHKTKKERGSYEKSIAEDNTAKIIEAKYPDVKRRYRDEERYPFNCDFYIPSLDLFIEYQRHWTHGTEPYNGLIVPTKWIEGSKWSDFYKGAIRIHTIKDPEKREYAKKNNLNYLEIWDYEGAEDLLKQISDYMLTRSNNT